MDLTNSPNSHAYTSGELHDADDRTSLRRTDAHSSRRRTDAHSSRTAYSHNTRRRTDAHSSRTAYSHNTHRDGSGRIRRRIRRRNIHGDMHASQLCGGRQQRYRALGGARRGLGPCLRTMTDLCPAIAEAI